MRTRRFRPDFDSLQLRIAPSTVVAAPTTDSGGTVQVADETGSPSNVPSTGPIYPYVMTPPGSTNPINTIC